jgi:hypothetical protein
VSAPEVLRIAKILKKRGSAVIENVRTAHEQTKDYDFDTRGAHPTPCPLLENDECSIYEERPMACRLAGSADAQICARTYHNITNEDIPMPMAYMFGRLGFVVSMAAALRKAGLPYEGYEFNAALTRALDTEDAEERWLNGENIFADILRDPANTFAEPEVRQLYEDAFTE